MTALINSMLGLLVFPQQRFMDAIPETPLNVLKAEGWPAPRVSGQFEETKDLRQLARYLRNAVAHCNLEFLADQGGEISGVKLWNSRGSRKTWEAELSVDELEGIVERFVALLERRDVMSEPAGPGT